MFTGAPGVLASAHLLAAIDAPGGMLEFRIGPNPDNKHAVPTYRNIAFDSAVPDWAAQVVRMDANKPKIEAVISGAYELNANEKAELAGKLRLTQPRVHSMAIVAMGATPPPPLRAGVK